MGHSRDLQRLALNALALAQARPGPVTVTVTETRAPTDESVALLAEMEEKIRERIHAIVPLANNVIAGTVIRERDLAMGQEFAFVRMKINDYLVQLRITLKPLKTPEERLNDIVRAVSDELASKIVAQAFESLRDHL